MAQKTRIVPLPGSRRRERLDENIGALVVELALADLQVIESAISKINVQGGRYPQEWEQQTNRKMEQRSKCPSHPGRL